MTGFRRFLQWLRPLMPYVNIGLAGAAWWANEYVAQVICQPVLWAAVVLISSVGAFLVWPWLAGWPSVVRYMALFLQGILVPVCVYCILFMHPGALVLGILFFFFLLPMLAWVPVVFAGQALRRAWRSDLPGARIIFALGMMPLLVAQAWAEQQYRAIEAAVAQLPQNQRRDAAALVRVVPRTYVAERLAGTLFKYHNYEESVLDGWRPPLHDPLVNISLWMRGGMAYTKPGAREANPLLLGYRDVRWKELVTSTDSQAAFYHRLFPTLPIKTECVCNHTYDGESYRSWVPNGGREMALQAK